MLARRVGMILRAGAAVFLLSSAVLIAAPVTFLNFLSLPTSTLELEWAMRMIGVTLLGLAGFMLMAAGNFAERALRQSALLMISLSLGLTALTFSTPGEMGVGKIVYLVVGTGFALAYAWALRGYRSRR
jgi:hypothetical protein